MPVEQIVAIARSAERILLVCFAGASLAMGWNLFRVGIVSEQVAELAAQGWKVRFQRVGPGVFFALFGAISLALAITHPLTLRGLPASSTDEATAKKAVGPLASRRESQPDMVYAAGTPPTVTEDEVRALNTVTRIAVPKATGLAPSEQAALQAAVGILDRAKRRLLSAEFHEAYDLYELRSQEAMSRPAVVQDLAPTERETYERIDRIASGTLLEK